MYWNFIYNIAYNMERKGVLYMLFNQLPSDYFLTKDQNKSTSPSGIGDPSRYWLYCLGLTQT